MTNDEIARLTRNLSNVPADMIQADIWGTNLPNGRPDFRFRAYVPGQRRLRIRRALEGGIPLKVRQIHGMGPVFGRGGKPSKGCLCM